MSAQTNDLIATLENELQQTLRPVRPDPEFVQRLQGHLVSPSMTIVERQTNNLGVFMVAFGLAVGLFVLWLVRQLR